MKRHTWYIIYENIFFYCCELLKSVKSSIGVKLPCLFLFFCSDWFLSAHLSDAPKKCAELPGNHGWYPNNFDVQWMCNVTNLSDGPGGETFCKEPPPTVGGKEFLICKLYLIGKNHTGYGTWALLRLRFLQRCFLDGPWLKTFTAPWHRVFSENLDSRWGVWEMERTGDVWRFFFFIWIYNLSNDWYHFHDDEIAIYNIYLYSYMIPSWEFKR